MKEKQCWETEEECCWVFSGALDGQHSQIQQAAALDYITNKQIKKNVLWVKTVAKMIKVMPNISASGCEERGYMLIQKNKILWEV